MQNALDAQASFALAPAVNRYAVAENKFWAAEIQKIGGRAWPAGWLRATAQYDGCNLVQSYEAAVDRYSSLSAATPLVR